MVVRLRGRQEVHLQLRDVPPRRVQLPVQRLGELEEVVRCRGRPGLRFGPDGHIRGARRVFQKNHKSAFKKKAGQCLNLFQMFESRLITSFYNNT